MDYYTRFYPDFDHARWSVTCRMMHVLINQRNVSAAVKVLREFAADPNRVYIGLDCTAAQAFGEQTGTLLGKVGLKTLKDVDAASDKLLLSIEYLGEKKVAAIRRTIEKIKRQEHPEIGEKEIQDLIDEGCIARADK